MLNRWIARYCRLLDAALVFLMVVMVVMVFGNVLLRYGFNSGITISEELARLAFVWTSFLGAVVALYDGGHIGSDWLYRRLSPAWRRFCHTVVHALMLYLAWLIFQGSWQQVLINWDVRAPVTGLSQAWLYVPGVVLAISAALILPLNCLRGWQDVTATASREPAENGRGEVR